MLVTYKITSDVNRRAAIRGAMDLKVDVHVTRTCDMGNAYIDYEIKVIGDVATVSASVAAWIAADIASLTAALAARDALDTLKAAFDLAVAGVTLQVDL
jgi:hypothetical protein